MLSLGGEPRGNKAAEPANGNDGPRRIEDQQAVRKGHVRPVTNHLPITLAKQPKHALASKVHAGVAIERESA